MWLANLTTVSNSVRDFTVTLLGYFFADAFAADLGPGTELATFLKWGQLASYARAAGNEDWAFRGAQRQPERKRHQAVQRHCRRAAEGLGELGHRRVARGVDDDRVLEELAEHFHGAAAMALHGLQTPPFWLALAGVVTAWWFHLKQPSIPEAVAKALAPIYRTLENKYYMDWFNENVIAPATRAIGTGLWKGGDQAVIDGVLIDGSAKTVGGIASLTRLVQTGYIYWYALVMLLGLFGLLTWQLWPDLAGLMGRTR